jgi:hypothetical protein
MSLYFKSKHLTNADKELQNSPKLYMSTIIKVFCLFLFCHLYADCLETWTIMCKGKRSGENGRIVFTKPGLIDFFKYCNENDFFDF